ncbi:hypothetical protein IE81DRAFT_324817 [Ceraceosorus guamensis]|uniref:2-hydroxyacid dehydrogenase n=1 Tax=Ceraceosorus guamensis TaxID=1522189 RepID=A0A316W0K3_9BASI|nr:hypothetical protein IE81DRAFT_324817 [Ceraceosorus guamensis]PWN41205.1 hypothetical protein IE81DRAFT_324817 [Ceraceosorus guamensis]
MSASPLRESVIPLPSRMIEPVVLICGTVDHACDEQKDILESVGTVHKLEAQTREDFFESLAEGGTLSGVTHIYRHNSSADKIGVFDTALIERLPSSVKAICHNGAGYDQIDVTAATKRGIWVSHTPGAVDESTADVAMWLILTSLRRFDLSNQNAKQGKWKSGLIPGRDPNGKTLGIVGLGGIGCALARRAAAFGMSIIYHNRNPSPSAPKGAKYISSLAELLKQADVVSLNLPLNDQTRGTFGREQFERMKHGAVLINTARGGVVDEEGMLKALESRQLGVAALDVFPNEPHIDERLRDHPNVIVLPHVGTQSLDTEHKMELQTFRSIRSSIDRLLHNADDAGKPDFLVKEQQHL